MKTGATLPAVTFHTRVRDDAIEGSNPFRWEDKTTADYFAGKRVILFSLPGAFTPTCSTFQLPGFENGYADFVAQGIDEIYCMSVNDSFVMNKWAQDQGLKNVKVIPMDLASSPARWECWSTRTIWALECVRGAMRPSSRTAWLKPGSKSPV